jgi:hypothetical protein
MAIIFSGDLVVDPNGNLLRFEGMTIGQRPEGDSDLVMKGVRHVRREGTPFEEKNREGRIIKVSPTKRKTSEGKIMEVEITS